MRLIRGRWAGSGRRPASHALPARVELSSAQADFTISRKQLVDKLTRTDKAAPLWWRYCWQAAQWHRAWLQPANHQAALADMRDEPNGQSAIRAAEAVSYVSQALAGNGPARIPPRTAELPYLTGQAADCWTDALAIIPDLVTDGRHSLFSVPEASATAANPELMRQLRAVLECLDNPSRDGSQAMVAITSMLLAAGRADIGAELNVPIVLGKLPPPRQADDAVVTGVPGKLRLRLLPSGPPGLFPDPAALRIPRGDQPFKDALTLAWRSAAGSGHQDRCVLWRLELGGNLDPASVDGGSLGAAFAVALRELWRLPTSGWSVPARVRSFFIGPGPKTAITGALTREPPPSYGPVVPGVGGLWLGEVGHIDAKLQVAWAKGWRLVAPAANRDPYSSSTLTSVYWVKTIRQAEWRARRIHGWRIAYTTASLALLAALVLVAVQILTPTAGPVTQQDISSSASSPLDNNIPLSIAVGLEEYEKGSTPTSASAVAAAAAEPLTGVISMGEGDTVNSLAFSPDGKELLSSDSDSLLLRNLVTGAPVTLAGTVVGPIASVAFSPNGKMIAGGDDDIAFLANPAAGSYSTVPTIDEGAPSAPTSLTFSPDSETLAIGTYDGQIVLQNLANSTSSLLSYGSEITDLAYSPDGKMLAVGQSDGKVTLHRFHHFFIGEDSTLDFGGQISSVAFSPNGQLLASGDDDGIVFLSDLVTGATTKLVVGGSATSVAFSPIGQLLVVGNSDDDITLYDTTSHAFTSLGANGAVDAVAFSPDGKTLATGDGSQVDLWSVTGIAAELGLGGDANSADSVAFSPDSQTVASGYEDGQIILDNMSTGARRIFDDGSQVNSVAFSPNGKLLATTDQYGLVMYNLATGARTTYWNTNDHQDVSPDTSVEFSPAGKLFAIGGAYAIVWNASTGEPTNDGSGVNADISAVAYGPGGKTLAVGSDEGVYLLNPQTGLQDPANREGDANLTPDAASAVVGYDSSAVSSVAYSPDGTVLAVGDAAGNAILYRLTTEKPVATLAYGSPVKSVAYTPNGQWLAVGTADGRLILRNVDTGLQITKYLGSAVASLAFSPNGQWLASTTQAAGGISQQVTLYSAALWDWAADIPDLRSNLCQETGGINLTTSQWAAYFPGQPYQQTCPAAASLKVKKTPAPNPYALSDIDYHAVSSIAFSPSGETIAAGDTAGVLYQYRWNGTSAAESEMAGGNEDNEPITAAAFSANGAFVGFADTGGHAYLETTAVPGEMATLAVPSSAGRMTAVAFSPDSKTFAAADNTGHVYLWNTRTGQLTGTLANPDSRGASGLAYSPDGETIATGDGNGHTYLWNARTGNLTATLTDPGSLGAHAVAYSPDGETIATGDGNGHTYLWNARTGKLTATLTDLGAPPVNAVAFQPGGTTVATADASGHTYLWNVATHKVTATLTDPDSLGDESLAFSPNGKVIAIADANGKAYLWTLHS